MPLRPAAKTPAADLSPWLVGWAENVGLTEHVSPSSIVELRFGVLVDAAFPHASEDRRRLAAAWMLLLCLLDDFAETHEGSSRTLAARLECLQLRLGGTRRLGSSPDVLGRACDRFHRLTTRTGTMHRFHREVGTLFAAYVEEHAFHGHPPHTGLQRHVALRRTTSGVATVQALFPLMTGYLWPERRRRVQQLAEWASDLIAWSNDLWTAEVERDTRAHNLLFVLERAHGLEPLYARRSLVSMHNVLMRRFVSLVRVLLHNDLEPTTRAFVAMQVAMVRAHYDWAGVTGLYAELAMDPR
ncbi:MAG: terpene synthase family protein [Myxococcota bacterium]